MALTARRAMSVTYGFRDQEGTESNMLVHMTNPLYGINTFVGFIEYLSYSQVDLANHVAQLSECDMSYIGLKMNETEDLSTDYGTGEAEKKGVFLFNDEHGAPSFRMAIPGIKESLLQANGRDIDLTTAPVIAYLAGMITGGVAQPTTPNNFHLGHTVGAYKQHRRSHKGGSRRTG